MVGRALTFCVLCVLVSAGSARGQRVAPPPEASSEADSVISLRDVPSQGPFFFKNRSYGTDQYAGPFDVILNKGLPTAAWLGRSRDVFDYPYGWQSVWASVTRPLDAIERYGGWSDFLRQHNILKR